MMSPHLPQPTFVNPLNFVFLRNAGGSRSTARLPAHLLPPGTDRAARRSGSNAGRAAVPGSQRAAPAGRGTPQNEHPQPQPRFPPFQGLLGTSALSHSPTPGAPPLCGQAGTTAAAPRALRRLKMAPSGRPSLPSAQAFPSPEGGAFPAAPGRGSDAGGA